MDLNPAINGFGQIAFSTVVEVGPDFDDQTKQWTQVFIDDVEASKPGPSDDVTTLATTQAGQFYYVVGINNNGQIAGTFVTADNEGDAPFFMNTDGTFLLLPVPYGQITGFNDDVQLVGNDESGGFIIDTQH
jgi:hypothetical protein